MTPDRWVFAVATLALAVALAHIAAGTSRQTWQHPAIGVALGLFVVALLARALLVVPSLIHADLAAPLLVDCTLDFPAPCTNRGASYGQYGFWLTGGMSRLLGGDLDAIFTTMQIIGAANVALLALLACRYSQSPYGALFAVAALGMNPIFMRVAASEEMHNAGLLLALIALAAIDVFAVTPRPAAIVAAVIALCLMIHTRQTFYVFAPSAFLLALARGGWDLLRSKLFWIAGLAVLATLIQRVWVGHSDNIAQQMIAVLTQPALMPNLLRYHPLFDVLRYGPIALLTLAAIGWAVFAGGVPRAMALVFAINFLVTYPCGMPSPGVELAQRLGTHALGILLVALFMATSVERRVSPARRNTAALRAAVALFIMPPLFPGWQSLGETTPIHREYRAVEAAVASLPDELSLQGLPPPDWDTVALSRYEGLLRRAGKTVRRSAGDSAAVPRFFLENVECWTYDFNELTGVSREEAPHHEFEYRWDRVIFGRQPSPIRPPAGRRPECLAILRDSTPVEPRAEILDPADDPPFLFYSTDRVSIQFHRLGS